LLLIMWCWRWLVCEVMGRLMAALRRRKEWMGKAADGEALW
jgi:hypothetical protein